MMKVTIDIPNELIVDYDTDKFHDCFMRFIADCSGLDGLVGNYEVEILYGLDKAFENSVIEERS